MKSIPVRFYSLHLRSGEDVLDYQIFFDSLRSAVGVEVAVASDYTVVLDYAENVEQGTFELVLFGGDPSGQTVFYDRAEGGAVVQESSSDRWSAKPTRVVVSIGNDDRMVALESARGGVTPLLFERYLERIKLEQFPKVRADVTPLAGESFIEEIEAFERIRVASIEVARPNYDWADHANRLYELAEESKAETSTAEVKAARGESLDKHAGLVGVIQDVVKSPNPSVRNAKVTGRKPGDVVDQTVSLLKHQERATASVDQNLPLDKQSASLLDSFRGLLSRLRGRRVSVDD